MMSNKLVVKVYYELTLLHIAPVSYPVDPEYRVCEAAHREMCGNFAVLVDLHVLPQGTSKDSSWFSDHEKEEVCLLLKDTIDTRVKQHLESRRQQGQVIQKEYTQASPLFLKGTRLRIAAYFIKRWVNLRCVVQRQYRELYVFPDRFVVCVSQLEAHSSTWAAETVKPSTMKESSSGTSEYFAEHRECEINNMLSASLTKQAVLKNIVKKTKAAADSRPESGRDCKACPRLGQVGSDKGSRINTQSEPQCRSAEQAKDCLNISQKNSELPDGEVENDFNSRQPCRTSSQHKPQSAARLQTQDPTKALSWICESALPEQKQTLRTSIMQQKRRRHSSEGKSTFSCKKADLRDDMFIRSTEEPVDPLASRGLENFPLGDATESVKPKTVTDKHEDGENKLHMSSYSTCQEKRPAGGPPRKLKLQRPKKGPLV